jgi:hypothetical protein
MLSQTEMMEKFMPLIKQGKVFHKQTKVDVRFGQEGERIVTVTSDGKETENVVGPGDFVVTNRTEAREEYILSAVKLAQRYRPIGEHEDGHQVYQAVGSAQAHEYEGEDTEFEAPWGEAMTLKQGDMLVTPLPDCNEVYRIARKEFDETYGE